EVGDVVAVQVGDEHAGQAVDAEARGRQAHQHPAARVDQHVVVADRDEGGGTGPVGVGDGAPGAEERDGDHWRDISALASASRAAEPGVDRIWISTAWSVPSKPNGAS